MKLVAAAMANFASTNPPFVMGRMAMNTGISLAGWLRSNCASMLPIGPNDGLENVPPHDRVQARAWFVQDQQVRPIGQRRKQPGFRLLSLREGFDLLPRVQLELFQEFVGVVFIPAWIKGLRIADKFVDPHPTRQITAFRQVANPAQHPDRIGHGIKTEHAHGSRLLLEHAEQMLDERGFSGTVFTDQTEHRTARDEDR
jgi:hypothetical protein